MYVILKKTDRKSIGHCFYSRLEAIVVRLEAFVIRLGAISIGLEAIASTVQYLLHSLAQFFMH